MLVTTSASESNRVLFPNFSNNRHTKDLSILGVYGCQASEASMSVKSHQSRDVRYCGVELRPRVARTPFIFMACMATLARDSFAPGNMPITMDTDYYYYYY